MSSRKNRFRMKLNSLTYTYHLVHIVYRGTHHVAGAAYCVFYSASKRTKGTANTFTVQHLKHACITVCRQYTLLRSIYVYEKQTNA